MQQKINDFNVIITKIVVAHKYVYKPCDYYDCAKGRNSYGIVQPITGTLHYTFYDGRQLTVNPGDCIVLKPEDKYKVSAPQECEHYTVNFQIASSLIDGKIAKRVLLKQPTAFLQYSNATRSFTDIFEQLCIVWKEKKSGYQMQANILTSKLLYNFIKKQIPLFEDAKFNKLKPAIDLLEQNWNSEISLSDLASVCLLSVAHFRHLFTEVFKMSPIKYRDYLRILYAKDYLLQECYTITEISCKCGFKDVNYFSRFFKKHTGISPSKYTM